MARRRSQARSSTGAAALGAVALSVLALGVSSLPGSSHAQAKLPVVTTFGILADVVERVGGDAVHVVSLVDAGGDVHVFQPGPNHARQLAGARLVVSNGLGFEGWVDRLVRSSGYAGPVAVATRGIEPLRPAPDEAGAGHHVHPGEASRLSSAPVAADLTKVAQQASGEAFDPHAWQSVPNMKRYVVNIAEALCEVAVASCEKFQANAGRYSALLDELDRDIRRELSGIPAEQRKVITSHRAFAYYAREYGVQFLAPVGVSTDVEPSAAAVGRLIRQIRKEKVEAFFVEGISDPRLIERIRAETGGARPGRLYSDNLSGPEGPAATYEAMMRYNTRAITAALSGRAAVPPARQ